ncbi:ATP-binding protein [Opitutus sp. GAS368]|jgi:two-component system OmpR family sensor kinase|uniref:sensor histidine kinase n=1 Tax=Opitutus sp. GAS368 TaxID=1882749 RepID=UPI00087DD6CB|nr:ATP-binding protein [Opitutus sp. GAS368]SDS53672.1 Signal transduction histidine kinase [Opitutus sp. GAS368]
MKAWWGRLSLRTRLAAAFGAMAAGALIFLLAVVARTIGVERLEEGKIVPALLAVLAVFFIGGWFVAGWCLDEIGRLGTRISAKTRQPLPAELEGLAALLRREAQKHDRLLAELRRFTADASHELRTPLTALRTVGEVALRQSSDPAVLREAIGSMLEEAQRMNTLVGQLLRLARLESDELPIQRRTVELRQHLAAACDSVAVLAEEKQIQLDLECPAGLQATADVTLLLHAVVNLLDNAIRHSPPGSTIRLGVDRENDVVNITVIDQGPGIPAEHRERIFERFYRLEPSRLRPDGGAGLGLCIAKTAIERLDGRIVADSGPGGGAMFRITLPALPSGAPT